MRGSILFTVVVTCVAVGAGSAHAHDPKCTVVPIAEVEPVLLEAARGDLFSEPPLVANDCMHGKAHVWRFFWGVREVDGFWREYGFARCYLEPMSCHPVLHVATGDDASYIEIPGGIPLPRLRELVGAVTSMEPRSRVTDATFGVVNDGTRWSEERFGYDVTYSDPSEQFGTVVRLIRRCETNGCAWTLAPEMPFSRVAFDDSDGCRAVNRASEEYRTLQARARLLFDSTPNRIVDCPSGREGHIYVVRYEVSETFEGWKRHVEVQCAVATGPAASDRCDAYARGSRLDGSDPFDLSVDISLSLAVELRALVSRRVPGASVVSVHHNAVSNGGAWSSRSDGYSVAATGGLKYAAGAYYQVVEQCVAGSCGLHFVDLGSGLRTWVY